MLYIFHVDTGTMMTFDMKFAVQNVMSLKEEIEKKYNIPTNKQVLLVSGGEMLRPDGRICSYSSGTDTNPIYMFSKTIIESDEPPKTNCDYSFGVNYEEKVRDCLTLPSNYNTIVKYTQLSQELFEYSRKHIYYCEELVHDQHLQQQGWSAVVANMEDVTKDFKARADDFEKRFIEQVSNRNEYQEFLTRFNDDLEMLASIPILPALRSNAVAHPFNAFDELEGKSESYEVDEENASDNEQGETSNFTTSHEGGNKGSNSKDAITLLHWINIKENQDSLKHIAEYCKKAMDMFDDSAMTNLRIEIKEILMVGKKKNMRSIMGLEDRLFGLETLMCEARSIVQEQKDLMNAFQNQQNAASMGDTATIIVLCESLRSQLQSMLRNHLRLSDILRRCLKAKDELALNLYHRLKWIVYVENHMFETDSRLMFYHRSLARLRRHLIAVGQLHRAPSLYCTTVSEIVRRRTFSQAFLTWATKLANQLMTIHTEEVNRRRMFRTLFSGHFLSDLFPGIEDMPPPFATQPPKIFDADLPKLTQNDLELLSTRLPHLTPEIPPCDITSVINFFQSKSDNQEVNDEKQLLVERLLAVKKERKESDRGCESETDTEEYVKVGQSSVDRGGGATQPPVTPKKCDATTMSEETIGSKKDEVDRLKKILTSASDMFTESITHLRTDLNNLKSNSIESRMEFKEHFLGIKNLEKYINDNATREREAIQRLTVDHELEMNDIKKLLERKDSEIILLKNTQINETMFLNNRIKNLEESIVELNKKMVDMEDIKQKALKDLQDKLTHEHKIEVESLRSRFRLVACTTSMDRSPSESSLEKIERTDMIEIANHKSILMQCREDMELEKEEAIKRAIDEKEREWVAKLASEVENVKRQNESEKQTSIRDAMKRIIEEKDRQLDKFQQRENQLHRECMKYKETLEQLTDPETSDAQYLQVKLCSIEEENRVLKEKCKKYEQLNKGKQRMPKGHIPLGLLPKALSITSCNVDDTVLVMWDGAHYNYTIFQESPHLFLLHGDCLAALDLKLHVKDESERRLYAVGKVENKDYCAAVKTGNKYHVTVGQRFYRIKVRPLKPHENPLKDITYCCEPILKETYSSQNKAVMRMAVSEAVGSYDSSPKQAEKYGSLTKSVYPVVSLTSSMSSPQDTIPPVEKSTKTSDPPASLSPIPQPSSSKAQEQLSVAKFTSDLLKETPADVVDNFVKSESEDKKFSLESNNGDWYSINRQEVSCSENIGQSNFEIQPESVPYASCNEAVSADDLSKEQIVSEVAEEAAP